MYQRSTKAGSIKNGLKSQFTNRVYDRFVESFFIMTAHLSQLQTPSFLPDNLPKIIVGDFEIDQAAYLFRYRGKRLALPMLEYRLLVHFMQNTNRAYSRSQILAVIGRNAKTADLKIVNSWIGSLRRKFKDHGIPDPFRTVHSVGYVFDEAEA